MQLEIYNTEIINVGDFIIVAQKTGKVLKIEGNYAVIKFDCGQFVFNILGFKKDKIN
jgi:hypothetical protein